MMQNSNAILVPPEDVDHTQHRYEGACWNFLGEAEDNKSLFLSVVFDYNACSSSSDHKWRNFTSGAKENSLAIGVTQKDCKNWLQNNVFKNCKCFLVANS